MKIADLILGLVVALAVLYALSHTDTGAWLYAAVRANIGGGGK